jgi:hypothetical protein
VAVSVFRGTGESSGVYICIKTGPAFTEPVSSDDLLLQKPSICEWVAFLGLQSATFLGGLKGHDSIRKGMSNAGRQATKAKNPFLLIGVSVKFILIKGKTGVIR